MSRFQPRKGDGYGSKRGHDLKNLVGDVFLGFSGEIRLILWLYTKLILWLYTLKQNTVIFFVHCSFEDQPTAPASERELDNHVREGWRAWESSKSHRNIEGQGPPVHPSLGDPQGHGTPRTPHTILIPLPFQNP